jgi:hypothetical protein
MTRSLFRAALALSLAFAAAHSVYAQDCRNSDYRGVFGALALGNFITPPPGVPPGPTARVGRVQVDGNGNASITTTLSLAGTILQEVYGGTYTINPDCSAAVTLLIPFPGAPAPIPFKFSGMLADDGRALDIILLDPPGTDVRILLQKQRKANCSSADLSGGYMLNMNGTIISQAPNPAGLLSRVGKVTFDGIESFKGDAQTSYNGKITPESFSGAYAVDSQCTFTMTFGSGQTQYTWAGMLTDTVNGANLLVSAPQGAVITGTLKQQ